MTAYTLYAFDGPTTQAGTAWDPIFFDAISDVEASDRAERMMADSAGPLFAADGYADGDLISWRLVDEDDVTVCEGSLELDGVVA